MVRSFQFGFLFVVAGMLVMILALDIVWWQAILVGLLCSMRLRIDFLCN